MHAQLMMPPTQGIRGQQEQGSGLCAQDDRAEIRDRAHLLITNPDMLHCSVLPVHGQFGRLLANLRYVVVDEGHAYRGVFGCHAALVLRRLRRVCQREYRRAPQFIVASATIANPREHIQQLLGALPAHSSPPCPPCPPGQTA